MCTKNLYRCIEERLNYSRTGVSEHPYFILVNDYETEQKVNYLKSVGLAQRIPCGQCFECKTLKAKEWAFRCMKEASKYDNNIMITLTYDDEHLPHSENIDIETGEVYSTLNKTDVVKFMKRLRKKYGEGIRFLMCGEYGSDNEYVTWKGERKVGTSRPHYHIILFNFCPEDLVFHKWSKGEWSSEKYPLYKSDSINKLWNKGFADCNEVTKESCEYVCRYTTKKLYGDFAKEEYEAKGRQVPFLNMSRCPGIGFDYFVANQDKFLNEQPMYLASKKGLTQINSIRYYDKQLEKLYPDEFEKIKEKRISRIDNHWEQLLSKTDVHQFEYLANLDAKSNSMQRKLKRAL